MHVLTYFCRTNVFGILTIWQGVGIVVPVYCKKSRIYVLFGAPNLYLVQLAEILRCSGRDWLRPGGAARAGALLVRPSLRRAPLGWSVAAADAPRCSWPRRCFPARQPSPWFPAGGCRRPPRALWRRRRDRGAPAAARNAAAAASGSKAKPCRRSRRHFCVLVRFLRLLAGKKAHFCRFQPRKWGLTHFPKSAILVLVARVLIFEHLRMIILSISE